MQGKLAETTCAGFTARLASSAPVPGGGGAAALMGALSASLCAMAAGLTRGKKKYESLRASLDEAVQRANTLRESQLALIDADAEAFMPLAKAYAMPREDPDYAATMRRVSLEACAAPMEMLRLCVETAELLERLLRGVSPLLVSDLGCAAAACRAAIECAAMNVWVNTKTLRGDAQARELDRQVREIREDCLPRLEAVVAAVRERLVD